MAGRIDKNEDGFTLIESVAAWTILVIAVSIFLKCIGAADTSFAKGVTLRRQFEAAAEAVELLGEPLTEKEGILEFKIDGITSSMEVIIREYGEPKDPSAATLKTIDPVPQRESDPYENMAD